MKLANGVELIDGTMANCYSVYMNSREFLVDTGLKSSGKKIISYYRNAGKKPDVILITHYHPDHVGGLQKIVEEFNPEVYAPDVEIGVIKGTDEPQVPNGLLPKLAKVLLRFNPVDSVKPLSELDEPGVEVVDSHGHTPGSSSFNFAHIGALFVGDAIFNQKGAARVNRTSCLDLNEAEKSLKKLLDFSETTIYPGHGLPIALH